MTSSCHYRAAALATSMCALLTVPASANPPCPTPGNPTACGVWDALGGFVGIEQLDDTDSGLTAVCATGLGFGGQGALQYTMAGAAVALRPSPTGVAILTAVACRMFTSGGSYGGPSGGAVGPAAVTAGLSDGIPFFELNSRMLCIRAAVIYINVTTFVRYGGNPNCPTGWE